MVDSILLIEACTTRHLRSDDAAAIQGLIERCADYVQLVSGQPPQPNDGEELLTDRPPNKSLEGKIVLGLFDEHDRLIGVLDAVRDYPEAAEWYIGLLMIDPDHRRHGLGTDVYRAFERWAANLGARAIRLGVFQQNEQAQRFWQRMGFEEVERRSQHFGELDNIVIIMRRET
jgi:ribosomal protein S18 acetylase RimI-like enzyme